jgi:L-fuconolactonase
MNLSSKYVPHPNLPRVNCELLISKASVKHNLIVYCIWEKGDIMRVDAHQHFWHYILSEYRWIHHPALMQDFMPDDLAPLMATREFEGTIAVQARSSLEETQWLCDLAGQFPFIKGVVGWVDLCDTNIREHLALFSANPVFRGVRTSIRTDQEQPEKFDGDFLNGMAILGEFEKTFDILIRPDHLPLATALVERFPEQIFILDHIANPPIKEKHINPWEADIRNLARHPRVYCKVSGMVTRADHEKWSKDDFKPYLDVVFDAFGPERLMIGSDWPVCTQAATYQQTMDIVLDAVAGLPAVARDAVLGGTAIQVYNI